MPSQKPAYLSYVSLLGEVIHLAHLKSGEGEIRVRGLGRSPPLSVANFVCLCIYVYRSMHVSVCICLQAGRFILYASREDTEYM